MGSKISKIEYYLPEKIITNDDLIAEFPDWNASKIESKVGIRQRHIAAPGETALDMAVKAGKKLLSDIDHKLIDFILLCTQSPEYLLPTTACILQDKLGLRRDIGAFDFNLGCSGYVYGLAVAKSLIKTKIAKNVLLVTTETYSKFLRDTDVSNRSIFGDAATATLISQSENEHIGEFVFGTDGSGADNLIVRNIGARSSYVCAPSLRPELQMNGPEIFNFTIETIPPLIEMVCQRNSLKIDDVSYVILHQANKYILDFLISAMKIQPHKCHVDLLNYGNTVSNTIPIALKDAWDRGLVGSGDIVLLAGFGVGYSWAGSTIIV